MKPTCVLSAPSAKRNYKRPGQAVSISDHTAQCQSSREYQRNPGVGFGEMCGVEQTTKHSQSGSNSNLCNRFTMMSSL
eukprot:3568932-Amphidinium_carterae.1